MWSCLAEHSILNRVSTALATPQLEILNEAKIVGCRYIQEKRKIDLLAE
jgi:hypothetical protein